MQTTVATPTPIEARARANRQRLLAAVLASALGLLAAFAYRTAISADFTGGDTLALIEVSRLQSLEDFQRILTQPMLPIITKFFRPTANLSYSLDYALWGLDARGFHITDVAVHALSCALLVLFVLRCSSSWLAAAVAGLVFALHPILMEVVPTTTRRQDMLGGMFVLLTLTSLPRLDGEKPKWLSFAPALLACALALGAKEAGVLLPALIFLWALFFSARAPGTPLAWLSALKTAAPFAALTVAFLGWRALVLGGVGGNAASWRWNAKSLRGLAEHSADFFGDLCYPLRIVFHPFATSSDRILVFLAALVLLAATPAILRWWRTERQARGAATNAARAALPLAIALCVGVLGFQFAAATLRNAIEQAYDGNESSWLAQRWRMGHGRPVDAYLWQAFDAARVLATLLLLGAAAWLAWSTRRAWSPRPRLFALLGIWLLLHLALFLAVQRYHAWNACMPAIPFCGLLGLAFAQAWRSARPVAFVLGAAILWLTAYSPLVRGLAVWNKSGEFNTHLMAQLERIAAEVPAGSRLEFEAFPNLNISWQREGPEPTSAFTLNEASLKSWMKMCQPDKHLAVEVRSTAALRGSVDALHLLWSRNDSGAIVVRPRATDQ